VCAKCSVTGSCTLSHMCKATGHAADAGWETAALLAACCVGDLLLVRALVRDHAECDAGVRGGRLRDEVSGADVACCAWGDADERVGLCVCCTSAAAPPFCQHAGTVMSILHGGSWLKPAATLDRSATMYVGDPCCVVVFVAVEKFANRVVGQPFFCHAPGVTSMRCGGSWLKPAAMLDRSGPMFVVASCSCRVVVVSV
jgi:hypothetical protein